MLFNSYIFIFIFLPVALIGWYGLNRLGRYRLASLFLSVMSLWFYAYFNVRYLAIILCSIGLNYLLSFALNRAQAKYPLSDAGTVVHGSACGTDGETRRNTASDKAPLSVSGKIGLLTGLILNLGILFYFKYYDFFIENINLAFHSDFNLKHILLPLGISFFTFQQMSYIIDRALGRCRHYDFINYLTFVTFFPQLIAGPIVLHSEIIPQFEDPERRRFDSASFARGIYLFVLGLAKKVLLADTFGLMANFGFAQTFSLDAISTVFVILAYSFELYFDFSGYSDMAIGLGKMFGFEFLENFNYPYISKTVTEFWRRWHMSLSTWFREYVYIPLGGNRVSTKRHILNLLIVWSLTGLWHGASWNFVAWGLYYGILLILEKYFLGNHLEKCPASVQHIYTMLIVAIGWVFFSSETLTGALQYLQVLFCAGGVPLADTMTLYLLRTNWVFLLLGILIATPEPMKQFEILRKRNGLLSTLLLLGLLALCTAYLVFSSYNPFLYFRF